VDGKRGDVGRSDDAPDGKRRAKLIAAILELVAEERRRESRVDEPGGDEIDPDRPTPGWREPVPPMKSSVPPGRTLPAATRATWSGSKRCSSRARRACTKSMSTRRP
jgi:hypothetical protein